MMGRLTDWVLAHRRTVVFAWLVVAVVGGVLAPTTIDRLGFDFSTPGQPAYEANVAIVDRFGTGGGNDPLLVTVDLPEGSTVDGARAELAAVFDRVRQPGWRVATPFDGTPGAEVLGAGGDRTAVALVWPPAVEGPAPYAAALPQLEGALQGATVAGVAPVVTGTTVLAEGGGDERPIIVEIALGAGGAIVVLALVFGSLLALVPLLVAAVAITTTFLLVLGLTGLTDVSFIVQYLVGADRAGRGHRLLTAGGHALAGGARRGRRRRHRRAHRDGHRRTRSGVQRRHRGDLAAVAGRPAAAVPAHRRLRRAAHPAGQRAGRAHPAAGAAGLDRSPAGVAAPAPTHRGEPQLAPDRRDGGAAPLARRAAGHRRPAGARAPGARHPAGQPGGVRDRDRVHPGGDGVPAADRRRAARGAGPAGRGARARPGAAVSTLAAVDGVAGVLAPGTPGWAADGAGLVAVVLADDPSSTAGRETLTAVRAAADGLDGARVGGTAAGDADSVQAIYGNAWWILPLVCLVTFALLAPALRSVWLPVKALLLNVVSIAAAYGITVWIWQEGHLTDALFGATATGTLTFWVPVAAFSFLFGLSMDYEVFILSRIREGHEAGMSTDEATVHGVAYTGRLVTSAALILFLAFVALSTVPVVDVKIFATTLAIGILLDATVVRGVLTPALVALLGKVNWWWPRRLARGR